MLPTGTCCCYCCCETAFRGIVAALGPSATAWMPCPPPRRLCSSVCPSGSSTWGQTDRQRVRVSRTFRRESHGPTSCSLAESVVDTLTRCGCSRVPVAVLTEPKRPSPTSMSLSDRAGSSKAGCSAATTELGTSRSSSDRSRSTTTASTVYQLSQSVPVTSSSSPETDRPSPEGGRRHSRRCCSFSCPASRRRTAAKQHHWLASTAVPDVVSSI